jgi:hypothetical protein
MARCLSDGVQQVPAGLLAAPAGVGADPAVLVHLGMPLALVAAALADLELVDVVVFLVGQDRIEDVGAGDVGDTEHRRQPALIGSDPVGDARGAAGNDSG